MPRGTNTSDKLKVRPNLFVFVISRRVRLFRASGFWLFSPSVLTGSRVRPFTDNQNTRERETDEILSLAQAARDVVLIIA